MTMRAPSPPSFADVLHAPPETWAAWVATAEAAERRRQAHGAAAAQRSGPCPCEGLDPFCETCVPFGRHLDPLIQDRRRQAHARQEALQARVRVFWDQWERDHPRGPSRFLPEQCDAFARVLRARREAAGLTVSQVSERAGLGAPEVAAIEARRPFATMPRPEPSTVLRLWWALGGGSLPAELCTEEDFAGQRERLGLTQERMAFRLGISRKHLHLIEAGKARPSARIAQRMREALSEQSGT